MCSHSLLHKVTRITGSPDACTGSLSPVCASGTRPCALDRYENPARKKNRRKNPICIFEKFPCRVFFKGKLILSFWWQPPQFCLNLKWGWGVCGRPPPFIFWVGVAKDPKIIFPIIDTWSRRGGRATRVPVGECREQDPVEVTRERSRAIHK